VVARGLEKMARVSFERDENALKWMVVRVAHIGECTKIH
jgi:hypothetical protein